ncbi:MAG TPA: CPBP family intramembrane glutamic endopeptidase [Candidatus Binatia bacterium]|nr:CPBP family intramembrane glutamic endopeptidase [Candidatus Binatia bacterium]
MSSLHNPQFEPADLNREGQGPGPLAGEPAPPQLLPLEAPKTAENPVFSGWDVLQIAGFTMATLFLVQLVVVSAANHFLYPRESWTDVAQKLSLALVSQLITYGLVALFMVLLIRVKYSSAFLSSVRWNWPRSLWPWIGIGIVLFLGLSLFSRLLPIPQSTPFDQFFKHPRDAYLTSIFAVTLGPLMEELFFRGFLYPVLARRLGLVAGVLITSLLFGLLHMFEYGFAWGIVLIIFLVGVACTVVRAQTKSVAASFLVHAGYNATNMVLIAIATSGFRHMDKLGG